MLRDWRKRKGRPGEGASLTDFESWLGILDKFLAGEADAAEREEDEEEEEEVIPRDLLSAKMLANLLYLRGLDHTLQVSTGAGLRQYLPCRRPTALKPGQERRFVAVDGLGLQTDQGGRRMRSCILDKSASPPGSFLECPVGNARSLHMAIDQGTVGWHGLFYIYSHLGVRGSFIGDKPHRWWNDMRAACKQANVWLKVLGCLLLLNLATGPWQGQAHHGTLVGAALDLFAQGLQRGGRWDDMYPMLYEDIAQDLGLEGSSCFGSASHLKQVWQAASQCKFFSSKGKRVKLGRWMSWF